MRKLVADAWVYNRILAPPTKEIQSYRGGPPPAAIGYASETALCHRLFDHEWHFIWSPDGESVAIVKDGVPVACIVAAQKPGYSRELIKNGPWGRIVCTHLLTNNKATMSIELSESGFYEWHDYLHRVPGLGIDSKRLNECVAYYHEHGLASVESDL